MRTNLLFFLLALAYTSSVLATSVGWKARPCDFADEAGAVECGSMQVHESHADPKSPVISFPVVIMRSQLENRLSDPVVILGAGGPGIGLGMDEASVIGYRDYYDWVLDSGRDLILLDPRGVGGARPVLTCPEVTEQMPVYWGSRLTPELEDELNTRFYSRCRDRLRKEGVALERYNTQTTAEDIDALRKALKIEQWNLYGTSYAATLALVLVRDFPDGIRSVILDSVQGPDTRFFDSYAANVQGVFQILFDACNAVADCRRDFPKLKSVLEKLIQRLNDNPIAVTVAHPLTLAPFPLIINGDSLVAILRSAMYDENNYADLPMLIYALDRGSSDLLAPYARATFTDDLDPTYADGVHLSVSCREEVPFNDMAATLRQAEKFPMVEGAVSSVVRYYQTLCGLWGVPAAPAAEMAAASGDVPALVFGGEWDPIIPPKWSEHAAAQLKTAHFFEFPVTGHDVMAADYCAVILAQQFLNDPLARPADNCFNEPAHVEFNTLPFQSTPSFRGANAARKRPLVREAK